MSEDFLDIFKRYVPIQTLGYAAYHPVIRIRYRGNW
jgi:hypothetical protein